jgi:hypothetical protein
MVYSVVYRSEANMPEADVSNLDILRGALARNPRLGLTGFLVRDRGRFLQVLEGPRESVLPMMRRIHRDPRHRTVAVMGAGERRGRRFGAWSMGYASGLSEAGLPAIAELDPAAALTLLERAALSQSAAVGTAVRVGIGA